MYSNILYLQSGALLYSQAQDFEHLCKLVGGRDFIRVFIGKETSKKFRKDKNSYYLVFKNFLVGIDRDGRGMERK